MHTVCRVYIFTGLVNYWFGPGKDWDELLKNDHHLEKTETWLAWERILPPVGPVCAGCGEIWTEAPADMAEIPLENTGKRVRCRTDTEGQWQSEGHWGLICSHFSPHSQTRIQMDMFSSHFRVSYHQGDSGRDLCVKMCNTCTGKPQSKSSFMQNYPQLGRKKNQGERWAQNYQLHSKYSPNTQNTYASQICAPRTCCRIFQTFLQNYFCTSSKKSRGGDLSQLPYSFSNTQGL